MMQFGVSVITVGHHQWLRELHEYSLDLSEGGNYKFYRN